MNLKFSDHQRAELSELQRRALIEQLDPRLSGSPLLFAECTMAALGATRALQHESLRLLAQCSAAVAYQLMHAMGGDSYYLPKGVYVGSSERDLELINKFNGVNHRELAREFGISVMRVRQILWKKTAAKPHKRPRAGASACERNPHPTLSQKEP